MIALGANSSNNLDFSSDVGGANLSLASLGAIGSFTYSGALTPYVTAGVPTYLLGGGGGTLTIGSGLPNVGSASALTITLNGTALGSVILPTANTYTGATTINASATLQSRQRHNHRDPAQFDDPDRQRHPGVR